MGNEKEDTRKWKRRCGYLKTTEDDDDKKSTANMIRAWVTFLSYVKI